MSKSFKSDTENYYNMSEPFNGEKEANEAVGKFFEELGELRKKHKIRDVLVVLYDSVKYDDGNCGEFMCTGNYGNQINCLPMAAYLYGQEQSEHVERINKMVSKKSK